jgi:hypothetical protein
MNNGGRGGEILEILFHEWNPGVLGRNLERVGFQSCLGLAGQGGREEKGRV